MKLFNMFRMLLGLMVGAVIFLIMSPVFVLSTLTPWPIKSAPWLWGIVSHYTSHKIAGSGFHIEGKLPKIEAGELLVIYANHPATIATSDFLYFVENHLRYKAVYVASETANPFVLWPAKRLERALIIPDNNGAEAVELIRNRMQSVLSGSRVIIIFPDGHRWTRKRMDWQMRNYRLRSHRWDVLPQILFARSGGLWSILQALEGHDYRLIEVGNAMNYPADAFLQIHERPTAFHVEAIEIPRDKIPQNRADFNRWLNLRWLGMAQRIAGWRR